MESKLDIIEDYWTQRSEGYSESIRESIENGHYKHWLNIIKRNLPDGSNLRILDVGCGPGFFPVILGREGYDVTAVDYTEAMLDQARANCEEYGVDAEFLRMDAQHLDFPDDSFDVVISRNLVWDLESPRGAYREWIRVLKPNGKMMVFDGNHYLYLYDKQFAEVTNGPIRDYHSNMKNVDPTIIENVARDLPLSRERRPQWDVDNLIEMGVQNVTVDTDGRDSFKIEVNDETIFIPGSFFICVTK